MTDPGVDSCGGGDGSEEPRGRCDHESDAEAVLVMPFVTVVSRSGPHDDASYTAGWEMGALDAELDRGRVVTRERVIHTANAAQADLIAMRHGYLAEIEPTNVPGWSSLRLSREEGD